VTALIKEGAVGKASPKEVGETGEIILTSLPTPEASEAVWLGRGGVLEGARPKSVLVELSTVSPDFVKHLCARAAEKGIDVLDAGISGGVKPAEEGTLTIMVGGRKESFGKVLLCSRRSGKRSITSEKSAQA